VPESSVSLLTHLFLLAVPAIVAAAAVLAFVLGKRREP
jgi:hypothetical protein